VSALGHVWTAPWRELSDAAAAVVGCGHSRACRTSMPRSRHHERTFRKDLCIFCVPSSPGLLPNSRETPAPVFELIDGNFILPPADLKKSFFHRDRAFVVLQIFRKQILLDNIITSATSSASMIKLIRPARWRSLARRERRWCDRFRHWSTLRRNAVARRYRNLERVQGRGPRSGRPRASTRRTGS
jgi:hypothetical protein